MCVVWLQNNHERRNIYHLLWLTDDGVKRSYTLEHFRKKEKDKECSI